MRRSINLMRSDLGDIEEPGRVFSGCECVAKHAVAKRAGGADGFGSGSHEFLSAGVIDSLAGFFTQEDEPAACSATERSFAGTGWVDHLGRAREDMTGLIVDAAVPAEVTRIVEDDALVRLSAGELAEVTGEKFAVMLNFD